MKIESYKDANEAVAIAHALQQGGKECALVITPRSVLLCPIDEVERYANPEDHVEYFRVEKKW